MIYSYKIAVLPSYFASWFINPNNYGYFPHEPQLTNL